MLRESFPRSTPVSRISPFVATGALLALSTALAPAPSHAQQNASLGPTSSFVADLSNRYRVLPDQTYHVSSGHESKLDLYLPRDAAGPVPVVLNFHGGGWVGGSKESRVLRLLPWLEMGWAVANVGYRLGDVARAPAAVEDAFCAVRWVIRNAGEYGFDLAQVVTTGDSAGGHLALITAMAPASAGLDRECPGEEEPGVAAAVNWYGITDVGDLLEGPNVRSYAVEWMGSQPDRFEIAERVSPLTYVRSDLPPILSIHGDADPAVPYDHAVRLHRELAGAGVPNELHTVPGGGHGGFDRQQSVDVLRTIRGFLQRHGLGAQRSTQ